MGIQSEKGFASQINYPAAADDKARVQLLIDMIPDPDAPLASSGAKSSQTYGFLDEMSPGAANQLRVELKALKAAVA